MSEGIDMALACDFAQSCSFWRKLVYSSFFITVA